VEEEVLSVTVQESGTSSRIINIPLKKGTTTTAGGAILRFSTTTGDTDDLNDVAVSGGILPAAYKIMVGNDRKLNVFLKSNPDKPIVEYIKELSVAKPANNSARKNAEEAKAALKEAQGKLEAALTAAGDAKAAVAKAQAEATAAAAAQAASAANVTRLTGEITTARGATGAAEVRAAAAEAGLAPLQTQFDALQAREAAAHYAEITARANEVQALERLADARAELARANEEHARELTNETDRLNANIRAAENALARERGELSVSQERERALQTSLNTRPTEDERRRITDDLANVRAETAALRATIQEKEGTISRTAAELRETTMILTRERDDATRELAAAREAFAAERTKVSGLETQQAEITRTLEAARVDAASSAEARGRAAELERNLAGIQQELADAKRRESAALAEERAARERERVLSADKGKAEGLSEEKQRTIDQLSAGLSAAREREVTAVQSEQGTNKEVIVLQEKIRKAQAAAEVERGAAQERAATATQEERTRILAEAARVASANQEAIRGLNTELQRLEREKADAAAQLVAARADVERLTRTLASSERAALLLRGDVAARNIDLASARSNTVTAQARASQLENALAALEVADDSERRSIREQLIAARAEAATKTDQLLGQAQQIATLERESGASAEKTRLIGVLTAELDSLHALIVDAREQQAAATASADRIRLEKNYLEQQIRHEDSQMAAASQEASSRAAAALDEERAAIRAAAATAAAAQEEHIRDLTAELVRLRGENAAAEKQVVAANAVLKENNRRLFDAVQELQQLQRLSEGDATTRNQTPQIAELETAAQSQSARIAELEAAVAAADAKSAAAEAATAAKDVELASLREAGSAASSSATIAQFKQLQGEQDTIATKLTQLIQFINKKLPDGTKLQFEGVTILAMINSIERYLRSPSSSGGSYTPANIHTVKIKTKKNRTKMLRYTVRKRSK